MAFSDVRSMLEQLWQEGAQITEGQPRTRSWKAEVLRLIDSLLGPTAINEHSEAYYEFRNAQDHDTRTAILKAVLVSTADVGPATVGEATTSTQPPSADPSNSTIVIAGPRQPFVFISYSHADIEFAQGLSNRLQSAAIKHFRDEEDIDWGQDIPDRIHDALNRATHLLILISPGSEKSAWVAYEVGYAKGRLLDLVPYLLHPSMTLPGFIDKKKYLRNRDEEAEFIRRMQRRTREWQKTRQMNRSTASDVSQAARLLKSHNPEARRRAIDELVRLNASQIVLDGLINSRLEVRQAAAIAASRMKLKDALPLLVGGLEMEGGRKRKHQVTPGVEDVFGAFGPDAVEILLKRWPKAIGYYDSQWITALAGAVDQSTVATVIAAALKQEELKHDFLKALLSSGQLLPSQETERLVLDYVTSNKDAKKPVARWLMKSPTNHEKWARTLLKSWFEEYCRNIDKDASFVTSSYEWSDLPGAVEDALSRGMLVPPDIEAFAASTRNAKLATYLRNALAKSG